MTSRTSAVKERGFLKGNLSHKLLQKYILYKAKQIGRISGTGITQKNKKKHPTKQSADKINKTGGVKCSQINRVFNILRGTTNLE